MDKNPLSVQEIIRSNMKKTNAGSGSGQPFGIEGYRIPDTSLLAYRPRTTKISKYNIPHFIDQYSKSKSFVPGPIYETVTNWKEIMKTKGKFGKSPRVTFTESVLHESKLKAIPGPGAYEQKGTIGVYGSRMSGGASGAAGGDGKSTGAVKSEKVCEFIEEARFRGRSTPAPIYEPKYVSQLGV